MKRRWPSRWMWGVTALLVAGALWRTTVRPTRSAWRFVHASTSGDSVWLDMDHPRDEGRYWGVQLKPAGDTARGYVVKVDCAARDMPERLPDAVAEARAPILAAACTTAPP